MKNRFGKTLGPTSATQQEEDMPITQQDADLIAATILARKVDVS